MNLKAQNGGSKMQTIRIILITLFLIGINSLTGQAQSEIDYSIKSNFLNPDTLKKGSNEYRIFWHFVKWTHKEADEIEILTLKAEFEKVGITTKDKEFNSAYLFFKSVVVFHKKSVEQWEHFKDLAPCYKKPK